MVDVVSTVRFVKTLDDGRDIPLRYTEIREDDKTRFIIEIWPRYPHSYGQAVFHYNLDL